MGQSWDNLYYRNKGRGDNVCALVKAGGVTYDELNERNPLTPASTPFATLPIAKEEIEGTYPSLNLVKYKALPHIAPMTVLRTPTSGGVTVLKLRADKGTSDAPPKAALFVSRKFMREIEPAGSLEIDVYIPATAATPEWSASLNAPMTVSFTDFAALVNGLIASGKLGPVPDAFELRTDGLYPRSAYGSYDASDWLPRLLRELDVSGALAGHVKQIHAEQQLSPAIPDAWWPYRYADADKRRVRVVQSGGTLFKGGDIPLANGDILSWNGDYPGIIYVISSMQTWRVAVEASAVWDFLPASEKAKAYVEISIFGTTYAADGSTHTFDGVTFTLSHLTSEYNFNRCVLRASIPATRFFAAGRYSELDISSAASILSGTAWGVVQTASGLINIDEDTFLSPFN